MINPGSLCCRVLIFLPEPTGRYKQCEQNSGYRNAQRNQVHKKRFLRSVLAGNIDCRDLKKDSNRRIEDGAPSDQNPCFEKSHDVKQKGYNAQYPQNTGNHIVGNGDAFCLSIQLYFVCRQGIVHIFSLPVRSFTPQTFCFFSQAFWFSFSWALLLLPAGQWPSGRGCKVPHIAGRQIP